MKKKFRFFRFIFRFKGVPSWVMLAFLIPLTSGAMGRGAPAPCPSPSPVPSPSASPTPHLPAIILRPGIYHEKGGSPEVSDCSTRVQVSQDGEVVFLIDLTNSKTAYYCLNEGSTSNFKWKLDEDTWKLTHYSDSIDQISDTEFVLNEYHQSPRFFERVADSETTARHFVIPTTRGWSFSDSTNCIVDDENGNTHKTKCMDIDAAYLISHRTCEKFKKEAIERAKQLCFGMGNARCDLISAETQVVVKKVIGGDSFFTGCETEVHVEGQ